jgi:hypothetical protein
MSLATAAGFEAWPAWLPGISTVMAFARFAKVR